MSVPLTPHPLQDRPSLVFLILAILTGVRWYFKVFLICISLIAKEVEYDLSVFWLFELLLLRILCSVQYPIFKIELISVLVSSFLSSLYILEIRPLSDEGW